jgi:hypothetical protein
MASRRGDRDGLTRDDRRRTERTLHRVDHRANVVAGERALRDRPQRVARLDDDVLHVRESLGGGEGQPAERRTRTRDRQHEAQADQRGEDAPASVDGALMAARRPGAGLTIGLDQTEPPNRLGGRRDAEIVAESGLELEDCGHGEAPRTGAAKTVLRGRGVVVGAWCSTFS